MTGGDECAAAFLQTAKISGLCLRPLFPCVTAPVCPWVAAHWESRDEGSFSLLWCLYPGDRDFVFGGGYSSAEQVMRH